ncbi:MAG: hypothetical protein ACTSVZ_06630 [Promethearchaeota archaeon]
MNLSFVKKPVFWITSHYLLLCSVYIILHLLQPGAPGAQADYITIHDFFQSGIYADHIYYFYLPVFWLFSPLYSSYTILVVSYFIFLGVDLFLLQKLKLDWFAKEWIFAFVVVSFYLDIERGNSNFIILTLALVGFMLLDRYTDTGNNTYLYITSVLFTIATYKLNFLLIVGLVCLWVWHKKSLKDALKFGGSYALLLLLSISYFLIVPSQLLGFLSNISGKNIGITINFIFEMNQMAWLFLGFSWILFNITIPPKSWHKRTTLVGLFLVILLLKYVGMLIHESIHGGSWV